TEVQFGDHRVGDLSCGLYYGADLNWSLRQYRTKHHLALIAFLRPEGYYWFFFCARIVGVRSHRESLLLRAIESDLVANWVKCRISQKGFTPLSTVCYFSV